MLLVEIYCDQTTRCTEIREAAKFDGFLIYFSGGNDALRLLMDRDEIRKLRDKIGDMLQSGSPVSTHSMMSETGQ